MPRKLRLAYFAHTLRSDWNNGNAHFLRGLMRALQHDGHEVTVYEPIEEWSIENLRSEAAGARALSSFGATYSDLRVETYASDPQELWRERLSGTDIVLLHEWNPPEMAQRLLRLRDDLGYKLLFHDTHHRASSSPEELERLCLVRFDGIVVFGEALRTIYREQFNIRRVWTLHEAADTTVFHPHPEIERDNEIVWIGNWGDGERTREICEFLLKPAADLRRLAHTTIYGVRYPPEGLTAVQNAGATYGGYLPNLDAPQVYARAGATVHIPRQQYKRAMQGIPTIRVFEALACGVPLVCAPWCDTENLFGEGDFLWARSPTEATAALEFLLTNNSAAEEQAARGRQTILARHTCAHRAKQLAGICEEVLM
jgi:spore maturation protein CgeB